jgi:DNA-binding response OmpR family regulator
VSATQRVLIVDQSPESREVLRTALERHGTEILEACRHRQGLEMARTEQPDVIVLDVEDRVGSSEPSPVEFGAAVGTRETPIVVLGTARCPTPLRNGEFVAKPYHYRPLIRRIEELLGRHAETADNAKSTPSL